MLSCQRYYGEVVKAKPIPGGDRKAVTVKFNQSYRQTIDCPCRELVKVDIRIDSDAFYPATFSPGDIVDVHSENDADKLYRGRVAAVDDANGTCDVYYYDGFGYERNVPTGERKVRLISPLSDDMSWLIGKEVLVKGPGNVHYTATISPSDGSSGGIGGDGRCRIIPKFAAEGKEASMTDVQAAEAALSLQMSRSLDERRIRVYTWPVSGTACPAETARKRRRDAVNYNEDEDSSSTAGSDGGDSLSQRRKTRTMGNLSFQSSDDSSEEEDIEAYNDRIAGSGGCDTLRLDGCDTLRLETIRRQMHEALAAAKRQRPSSKVVRQVNRLTQRGDQSQQSNRGTAERGDADGSGGLSSAEAAPSEAAATGQKDCPKYRIDPCLAETTERHKPPPSAETLAMAEAGIIPSDLQGAKIPNCIRRNMLRKL